MPKKKNNNEDDNKKVSTGRGRPKGTYNRKTPLIKKPNGRPKKDSNTDSKAEKKDLTLSIEQIEVILSFAQDIDLLDLTRKVYQDDNIDIRDEEVKIVRKIIADNSLEEKMGLDNFIQLTEDQKDFVIGFYKTMKPLELAKITFRMPALTPASKESIAVQEFIKTLEDNSLNKTEEIILKEYSPPKAFSRVLFRINKSCGLSLEEDKIPVIKKKGIERCISYLQSLRFKSVMDSLTNVGERELMESEFIAMTWDKPDLTQDEVNLCINLCFEYITQQKLNLIIKKLQDNLESIDQSLPSNQAIVKNLYDTIGKYNEHHRKSVEMQKQLNENINGARKERIEKSSNGKRSIAQLVQFVQEEENRKQLLQHSERRKKLLSAQMQKLEDEDETIARVFGVFKDDILEMG